MSHAVDSKKDAGFALMTHHRICFSIPANRSHEAARFALVSHRRIFFNVPPNKSHEQAEFALASHRRIRFSIPSSRSHEEIGLALVSPVRSCVMLYIMAEASQTLEAFFSSSTCSTRSASSFDEVPEMPEKTLRRPKSRSYQTSQNPCKDSHGLLLCRQRAPLVETRLESGYCTCALRLALNQVNPASILQLYSDIISLQYCCSVV